MKKQIRQAAAWLLVASLMTTSGIFNGLSAWADFVGERLDLASSSNAAVWATESDAEENISTPGNAVEVDEASGSDAEEYVHEFLTSDGILITIESDDSIWSDETTIEIQKVNSGENSRISNLVTDEMEDGESVSEIYAYDITFYDNGEEFEPDGTIKVTFTLPEDLVATASNAEIFHVNDSTTKVDIMETTEEEENTWSCIADGFSVYGIAVTSVDYIEIYTAEDLQNINDDLSGTYYLMNDIDLSGVEWTPIGGTSDGNFAGTLYGQEFTISGLSLTMDEAIIGGSVSVGLFYSNNGTIKDLNIDGFNFNVESSKSYDYFRVGTIAAINTGICENCHVSNTTIQVEGNATYMWVGGIAAYHATATHTSLEAKIENSTFDGEIIANSNYGSMTGDIVVGGIAGRCVPNSSNNRETIDIDQCINYGNVTGSAKESVVSVGGIAGDWKQGTIEQCANFGAVRAEGTTRVIAGGIVGMSFGGSSSKTDSMSNCYNAGNISSDYIKEAEDAEIYAGGLCGSYYGQSYSSIDSCYNLQEITAPEYAGGIIGYFNIYASVDGLTNIYYNGEFNSSWAGLSSKDSDALISCTMEEMKNESTFENFDFDTIWMMGPDNYPYPIFQWQEDVENISIDIDVSDNTDTSDLLLGWIDLDNGETIYYQYEDGQCELIKDTTAQLYYYVESQDILYEGNWLFDEYGYVVTGYQDGHFYYPARDGEYPYGMEVPELGLAETLKNNGVSSYSVLSGYNFINTFSNDLSWWTAVALADPESGFTSLLHQTVFMNGMNKPTGLIWLTNLPDEAKICFVAHDIVDSNDVSTAKKVLDKVLNKEFPDDLTEISSGSLYKVTKKGKSAISKLLETEYKDYLKSVRDAWKKNNGGVEWSDSFNELMESMDEDTESSYINYVADNLLGTTLTLMQLSDDWQKVMMDYSERIEFLEELEQAAADVPTKWDINMLDTLVDQCTLEEAARELKENYEKNFKYTLVNSVFTIIDEVNGWRTLVTGSDAITITSILSNFSKVDADESEQVNMEKIVGELIKKNISGLSQAMAAVQVWHLLDGRAKAIDTIVDTEVLYETGLDLLWKYEKEIKNGNASDENLVSYMRVFELVHNLAVIRYESMKEFYDATGNTDGEKTIKSEFLASELEKLEKITPFNYTEYKASLYAGEWDEETHRYYVSKDYYLMDCWKWIDGEKYYFNSEGEAVTGIKSLCDETEEYHDYYFSTGVGDIEANEKHYGAMQTGVLELDGNQYYFHSPTGYMAKDEMVTIMVNDNRYYDTEGKYDPTYNYGRVNDLNPNGKVYDEGTGVLQITLNCPLDILAYDSDGNIVAGIINDVVQEITGSQIVAEVDNNGQKIIYLPYQSDYSLKMTATGTGNMDYSVIEWPNANEEDYKKTDFRDITLSKGDVFYASSEIIYDDGSGQIWNHTLKHDNASIAVTEEQNVLITYSINIVEEGEGTAICDEYAIRGNYVTLSAQADEGNEFIGWYDTEGNCVSNDLQIRFRMLEASYLTARFTKSAQSDPGNDSVTDDTDSKENYDSSIDNNTDDTDTEEDYDSNNNFNKNKNYNSGDDSETSIAGTWKKDEHGWRYLYSDGTWESGKVITDTDGHLYEQISWKNITDKWWTFDADGYLVTGWVFDRGSHLWYYVDENYGMKMGWHHDESDGYWYYLDAISGYMLDDWRQINGKWYYFSQDATSTTWIFDEYSGKWFFDNNSGQRPYGSMYFNEETPDGYLVNEMGIRTIDGKEVTKDEETKALASS